MISKQGLLHRRAVVAELLRERGELLVVGGLGAPAWDITAAGDHPRNMPLWGGMGGAAMIGLGLALARPNERVLVVTGDGEMLMGLGSIPTIGVQAPKNLSLVVLDNEHYGETGMQETHTRYGVDLAAIAAASGFRTSRMVRKPAEVTDLRGLIQSGEGPIFAQIKIDPEKLPLVLPPSEGVHLKNRMREAILGPAAHFA
jgi:thiamine pyrophosphate-dependent acetolactate synthase large subunit-like protein